jgi:hypothetical protein
MQFPEPQDQHRWLLQLVGEWNYQHECSMGPDQPPMKSSGKQTTRALGELWILGDISGTNHNPMRQRGIVVEKRGNFYPSLTFRVVKTH